MELYAIASHHCNLSCPHCHIKDAPENYNRELFLEKLNSFEGVIVLFGGEPTVHRDRMFDIIQSNKEHGKVPISSVATNLMILDDELIKVYEEIGYISTSWNRTRFTDEQYQQWLDNCNKLEGTKVNCGIIITMTQDLLEYPMEDFLKTVDEWNPNVLQFIRFEHYIGDSQCNYFDDADTWLCNLYKQWRSKIPVETFNPTFPWYHDCKQTYTLEPDGTMTNTCPNGLYTKHKVLNECLSCENANRCKPCRLLSACSYPKKLRKLIESED